MTRLLALFQWEGCHKRDDLPIIPSFPLLTPSSLLSLPQHMLIPPHLSIDLPLYVITYYLDYYYIHVLGSLRRQQCPVPERKNGKKEKNQKKTQKRKKQNATLISRY